MMVDRGKAGEQLTWEVLVRNFNAGVDGITTDGYLNETVTAAYVELVDGALVFGTSEGGLVKSYGPGGWLEVTRA